MRLIRIGEKVISEEKLRKRLAKFSNYGQKA